MAMKSILCVLFWTLCSSLLDASATETNQVVSRTFDRPLADVRAVVQSKIALGSWQTNDVAGVSCTFRFSSCSPPVSSGIWRQKVIPLWVMLGGNSPRRTSFWMGNIIATKISDKQTRVEVCKQLSIPQTDTETSIAYMERIVAALKTAK